MSKERSTPEDNNLEQDASRFQISFPEPRFFLSGSPVVLKKRCPVVLKKRLPPEGKNALRKRRMALKQKLRITTPM
jgi:hypothetical protein